MCECVDVEVGSYDNQILLGFYPVMRTYRENRIEARLSDFGIPVDRCISDQVIELWEADIRTFGCCCGHNIKPGFINVGTDDFEKAINLGWEKYVFPDDTERCDSVKTKVA